MAKMRVQGSRVIISGHETTKEECNAVTLMCDEMAKSKDFRLVEYRPGYAEFEAVGQAEDLKIVPEGTNQLVWNGIIFCQNDYSRFMTYVSDTQFKLTSYGNLPESMVEQGWIDADNSNDFTYTAPRKILSVGGETWGEDGYVLAPAPPGESVSYEVILESAPSVPTPDWANCFVKTSAGNKAVEKVWIKQGSSLNVVWEAPAVTHKLFASEDMANNGGELSLFINGKSYDLKGNSTDYVEIKTGDVIEGSAFISYNEFMALALKGVDTETIYAQGNGGTDGAYLDVSYTIPSTLTEDLIFVEVYA